MKRKRSWFARFLALVALAAAVVAVVVVVSNTHLHHHSSNDGKGNQEQVHKQKPKKPRTTKKTYTVKSGDTLTSISQKTGITIAELQALNPEIDPQTLIAGEVLKLQK